MRLAVTVLALWARALGGGGQDALPATAERQSPSPTAIAGTGQGAHAQRSPVKEALRKGSYPWYDAQADRLQPVWPPRISWLNWLSKRIEAILDAIDRFLRRLHLGSMPGDGISGNALSTILLIALLAAFFMLLVALWFRLDPGLRQRRLDQAKLGTATRLAELPEGIQPESGDPWAEALRRRAAGDLAGAVICLFAHQLLCLDQMGLIRLVPGRTGRQYVSGLREKELADWARATLGLFELVYYGRRTPTPAAFEAVWIRALAFQERRAAWGASR
jgi:hypothetical protein